MTSADFHNWLKGNAVEWHWLDNNGEQDVILLPYIWQLESLLEICQGAEIECSLKGNYAAIWAGPICDQFGLNLFTIFPRRENDKAMTHESNF